MAGLGTQTLPGPSLRINRFEISAPEPHFPEAGWIGVQAQTHDPRLIRFPQVCSCCGTHRVTWTRPLPEMQTWAGGGPELASLLATGREADAPRVNGLALCSPCHGRSREREFLKQLLPGAWIGGTVLGIMVVQFGKVASLGTVGLGSVVAGALCFGLFKLRHGGSPCEYGIRNVFLEAAGRGWQLSFAAREPAFVTAFLEVNETGSVEVGVQVEILERSARAYEGWYARQGC